MKNHVFSKAMVFAIVVLFVVAGIEPVLSDDNESTIDVQDTAVDMEVAAIEDPYQEGWPQTILGDAYMWGGIVSPVVDDLDNDGAKEIVVTQQTDPVKLHVFNNDGTLKFPTIEISGYISPRSFTSIADIDYDGFKEIIVDVQSQIAIYGYDGALEDLWDLDYQASDGGIYRAPVLADLDNDSTLEVIYCGWYVDGSRLVVLDDQGVTQPGFPVMLEDIQMSEANMPAVGNFDEDPDLEIVVISHENNMLPKLSNIRAFNADGSLLWSQTIDVIVYTSPSAGDVNNDGFDEVIFTSTKGIHILDRFGSYMQDIELGADATSSNVALVDLDDDEYLEVIFGYHLSYYAMNDSGDVLWSNNTGYAAHYPPIAEDITGDGIPDIVVTSDYEVFGWDAQGDSLPNFPKAIEVNAYGACSVADIDNDNDIELIASADWKWIWYHGSDHNEGYIYIWDLSAAYDSSTVEWPMFHRDQRHTGRYETDIDDMELIVDDDDPEFMVYMGDSWNTISYGDANGGSTHYINGGTGMNNVVAWRVDGLVTPGTYDVYVWKFDHPWSDRMATNAQHIIRDKYGISGIVNVDQSTAGDEWVYLGSHEFDNSGIQGVGVTDNANGIVAADAIKLILTGP
jgi:hypothetical protein